MIPTAAEKEVQEQWDALAKSHAKIGWYCGTLMGDNHYRATSTRRRAHPGEPVMTEREYWRMRHAAAEQPRRALLLTPWSTQGCDLAVAVLAANTKVGAPAWWRDADVDDRCDFARRRTRCARWTLSPWDFTPPRLVARD